MALVVDFTCPFPCGYYIVELTCLTKIVIFNVLLGH
jgi:hypothetical protein